MAHFNVVTLQPTKTYASAANALKAIQKYAESINYPGRAFNVLMQTTPEGRFFPVIINVDTGFFHLAIHSGFCVVN